MNVYHMPVVPEVGQKRAPGPLELELQIVVSCAVNAGNGTIGKARS